MSKVTHDPILTPLVPTSFGRMLDFEIPKDCDIVIIAVNEGTGLKPLRLSLPHQLYEDDVMQMLEELNGLSINDVVVIPARSSDYITVAHK
jgi:hypothetical protein